jgi:hypothetical protein
LIILAVYFRSMIELAGVRHQLEEARRLLAAPAAHARAGAADPAYRSALDARNQLFHATRGLAAARGEPLPEMPVLSVAGGSLADHEACLRVLDQALAVTDQRAELPAILARAREPFSRYVGWARGEVTRLLAGR